MKTFLSNTYLVFISRLILGSVFIIASVDKISSPEAFASAVQAYKMIPFPLVNLFALIIPWIELVCGIMVVTGVSLRASAALLAFLLGIFLIGIVMAILRQLNIDCGCFGAAHASPVGWLKVTEDCGLVLLCLHIIWFPRSRFALESVSMKT